jgi:monoamine oxidase
VKKRVLIIGGGIAGLSAAVELSRNDFAVTVLEARPRFGGRIHTVRLGELPVELGAEFLHGQSRALAKTLRAAKLSIHEVSDRNRIFENGKFHRVNLWKKIERIIGRVNPREPDSSFLDFLTTQRLRERTRQLAIGFVQGFDAAHPERISAHALLRGQVATDRMANTEQGRIDEGYSALVSFMENDARVQGAILTTGAIVQRISWRRGAVEVNLRRSGITEALTAEAALVTLPLGVLKKDTVKFDPPLAHKRDAIRGLEFGNVVRVTLVFRERWWQRKDFGFVHAWDELFPTWWSDPRGPLVTGWAGGAKADVLRGVSAAELETIALKVLARIFSERASQLRWRLAAFQTHDWLRDPLSHGAYSYIPLNGLDLPKLLAEPLEGTLFFAGEATTIDAQMGTVSGAFDSGLRAARAIVES